MPTRQLFFWLFICTVTSVISRQDSLSLTKPKIIIGTKVIWEKSGDWSLVPQSQSAYSFGLPILTQFNNKFFQLETGLYLNSKALVYGSYWNEELLYLIFRYISVPINLRINTKYFYISAGPNFDYFVSQNSDNWPNYYYPKADMYRFTFGINANSGFQMTLHKTTIFIESRYSTNISPWERVWPFKYQRNFRNIGIGLGLRYSLGQRTKNKQPTGNTG